jgi:glycosyltransferase involved in cell wall biosynthesis
VHRNKVSQKKVLQMTKLIKVICIVQFCFGKEKRLWLNKKFPIFADLQTVGISLKIAVNTRLLLKNKLEGIGWFTYETLKRIVLDHPEHEFLFIFDRKYDDEFIFANNVTPIVTGPPARHPVLFYLWFEYSIPTVLKKYKPDLFISPDMFCSLRAKTKTLLVIHDLNFEHYPEQLPWLVRNYYLYFTPRFVHHANRIATVSSYSKQDIINQYDVDPKKIDVVYNGANSAFQPIHDEKKTLVREKFSKGCHYFLFIGALHPRKNLVNLFRAFDIYKKELNNDFKLVIVGEKMWWTGELKTTYENMTFKEDVLFTGRLQPEDLSMVVSASYALTYVSFFEGFGIPIVEAFNAETAVITSNVTSMPEIAGDAALLIHPFQPTSIADAMKKLTLDADLRQSLIDKGSIRRKDFSWDNTAKNLWKSALKVIESS